MKLHNFFLFMLLMPAIAGCGQPGPLYLPGHQPPIHVEPEPAVKPEPKPQKNQ